MLPIQLKPIIVAFAALVVLYILATLVVSLFPYLILVGVIYIAYLFWRHKHEPS